MLCWWNVITVLIISFPQLLRKHSIACLIMGHSLKVPRSWFITFYIKNHYYCITINPVWDSFLNLIFIDIQNRSTNKANTLMWAILNRYFPSMVLLVCLHLLHRVLLEVEQSKLWSARSHRVESYFYIFFGLKFPKPTVKKPCLHSVS